MCSYHGAGELVVWEGSQLLLAKVKNVFGTIGWKGYLYFNILVSRYWYGMLSMSSMSWCVMPLSHPWVVKGMNSKLYPVKLYWACIRGRQATVGLICCTLITVRDILSVLDRGTPLFVSFAVLIVTVIEIFFQIINHHLIKLCFVTIQMISNLGNHDFPGPKKPP